MRTSRPKTPVIYGNDETFPIGGLKVLRQSADDVATVVGAGVTVFEALKAHDALKAEGIAIRVIDLYSVQPIDAAALIAAGRDTGRASSPSRITTRPAASAMPWPARWRPPGVTVTRLAVREIPAQRQARRAARPVRDLGPTRSSRPFASPTEPSHACRSNHGGCRCRPAGAAGRKARATGHAGRAGSRMVAGRQARRRRRTSIASGR